MSFRTIIVKDRCKLDYSLNYLVCRKLKEDKKVNIDEIKILLIDSTQVSITSALITELSKKKVKIIFSDSKHNPECEVVSYQNNFYSYRKIKEQIAFIKDRKDTLWRKIIYKKIINQAKNLEIVGLHDSSSLLYNYSKEIKLADISNREGHSAKVYFNALFGNEFSRNKDLDINLFLNYGYSILLSNINREIKIAGYLTEIGIHHIGESNPFNLSCDLIEPLRPYVDSFVIKNVVNIDNYKKVYVDMLSDYVSYNSRKIKLDNAIHLYILDLLEYLKTGDEDNIKFIEYEL